MSLLKRFLPNLLRGTCILFECTVKWLQSCTTRSFNNKRSATKNLVAWVRTNHFFGGKYVAVTPSRVRTHGYFARHRTGECLVKRPPRIPRLFTCITECHATGHKILHVSIYERLEATSHRGELWWNVFYPK